MQVKDLLGDVELIGTRGGPETVVVGSVAFDSRRVQAGALFCCVPGSTTDGHRFAADAVAAGAAVLLVERFLELDVPQVRVPEGSVRPAMARVSAAFFGYPARHLAMVGVTGTNGKTTVTHLVLSILAAAGTPAGAIGTLTGERTTPESPDLQATLAGFRHEGRKAVAMEVSSHALTQHRVDGIVFDVAAFTNLSHDHLDHHHSMEAYFAAKARLFVPDRTRLAVINRDDPWGERLARPAGTAWRWPSPPVGRLRHGASTVGSSSFRWHGHPVTLPLSAAFNVDNALLAAAIAAGARHRGAGHRRRARLGDPAGPGPLRGGRRRAAVHRPGRLRPHPRRPGRRRWARRAGWPATVGWWSVRGRRGPRSRQAPADGGGGRPAGRRRGAHLRQPSQSEDPVAIIEEVRAGIGRPESELVVEPDRAAAIARAALGRPDPVTSSLIAGKGHETGPGDRRRGVSPSTT